jgi:hypothetical protein
MHAKRTKGEREMTVIARTLVVMVTCVVPLNLPSTVWAVPTISESRTITSPDQSPGKFGDSVGLSGNIGIFGQQYNDDVAPSSGAAFLFDLTTGHFLDKLVPPDGQRGDRFGISVDISGSTAIVGAWLNDSNMQRDAGAAYVFDTTDPENAVFKYKLVASDAHAFAQFGLSVAVDGATAIVGAAENQEGPHSSGAAYLFNTESGMEIAKLTALNGSLEDQFGISVDVDGDHAIVGSHSGSAYIFDISTGQQLAELVSPGGNSGDGFGHSVAIDGSMAIIGALADDEQGDFAGAAYLFDVSNVESPIVIARIVAPDIGQVALFGGAVDIDGSTAIVGAREGSLFSNPAGASYAFDSSSGALLAKLISDDLRPGDRFGIDVAIDGSAILVGSDINRFGAAFLYHLPIPEPNTLFLAATWAQCFLLQGWYGSRRGRKRG